MFRSSPSKEYPKCPTCGKNLEWEPMFSECCDWWSECSECKVHYFCLELHYYELEVEPWGTPIDLY